MAITRNKLLPLLGLLALAMIGAVLYVHFTGDAPVSSGKAMAAPPGTAASAAKSGMLAGRPRGAPAADADSAGETINTVVASNKDLRHQVQLVLQQNEQLQRQNQQLRSGEDGIAAKAREQVLAQLRAEGAVGGTADGPAPTAHSGGTQVEPSGETKARGSAIDRVGSAVDNALQGAGNVLDGLKGAPRSKATNTHGIPPGLGYDAAAGQTSAAPGAATSYKVVAPLGYEESKDKKSGLERKAIGGATVRNAVHALAPDRDNVDRASQAATDPAAEEATPYFTIPENATMTRVTAMTAIIGRVPVDGRLTDPMQFKAIIGRDNLAASGWELPDDLSGIIVSGIAQGDMAMSCSEGKIHSLTFVFDDGAIRTVSNRGRRGAGSTAGAAAPLGHISDLWGNPCIPGKFVTNAPAYLTDVVGLRSLGIGARAYAAAQTTTTENAANNTSSTSVNSGGRGAYVLGQAAAGATDEVTNWILSRLKNSFDAVVTRAGEKVVLHIEQQIEIDKPHSPRRLDHGNGQSAHNATGDRHGLD